MERAARMARITVPACLALIFLFSILTPEPGHVQGYGNGSIPAFVESDAAFALTTGWTNSYECCHPALYLPLPEPTSSASLASVSRHIPRSPPGTVT